MLLPHSLRPSFSPSFLLLRLGVFEQTIASSDSALFEDRSVISVLSARETHSLSFSVFCNETQLSLL